MERDSTAEPSGVDVQAVSSAVCGAVVSAFSEVLGRNYQNGGRSSSSSIVETDSTHPPTSANCAQYEPGDLAAHWSVRGWR